MPLYLTAAHHTATGLREHNEDFVGMLMPDGPDMSIKGMLAAVADGVSGSDRGQEAAEYAVKCLITDYYAMQHSLQIPLALDLTIKSINNRISQQGAARIPQGVMATTLTALVLHHDCYYFSHVGDSRLYRLRSDELAQLTTDHVLDDAGRKHVLTRAIGLDTHLEIEHGQGKLKVGDIFLLATDGIWSSLAEHELSWHVSELIGDKRSAGGTAKLLVDAALAAGSKDNLSALVVRIDQLPEKNLSDT